MRAIIYQRYGPPSVLRLEELPLPDPGAHEIRIQVKATAVNSADWRLRKADPWLVRLAFGLTRPRKKVLGVVFSGVVDKTGSSVTRYKAGQELFGLCDKDMGAYAEYLVLSETSAIAPRPGNLSHLEAACLPFGAHTALHFLRKANLKAGESILVYGASGAVGSAAVQLARHFGADVTAVCSKASIPLIEKLGLNDIIDYTQTDISKLHNRFDVVFETVGKTAVSIAGRLTKKGGRLILGAAMIREILPAMWLSLSGKAKVLMGPAKATDADMRFIQELAEAGGLKPVIDRSYPLEQIAEAHAYAEQGHKQGNLGILI